jgi:hypothetical protein
MIKKVIANNSKRSYTIIKENGSKYVTMRFSKEEFEDLSYNTLTDWLHFLKNGIYESK